MEQAPERHRFPLWLRDVLAGVPPHRALMCDMLRFQRHMPIVSQSKQLSLTRVWQARCKSRPVKWSLIFLKAFSIVAKEFPNLRRTTMSFPWLYFYQHPCSIGNLAITRSHRGEDWVFFAPFVRTDEQPLEHLMNHLETYKTQPVEKVFRIQLRLAHFPSLVRRVLWWMRLSILGKKRVTRTGTFGVTTLAGQGVRILDPKAPVTSLLTYGPINESGQCDVTVAYDHRVLDGFEVAIVLDRLEEVLNNEIAGELMTMPATEVVDAAA